MLSFIICTYNREEYISQTLCCLAENHSCTDDYEIILVDNNSTDSTASLCKKFEVEHPNVRYSYFLETQQGLSYARNRGVKEANGDILVFLDDDAFVQENYVSNLINHLKTNSEIKAFGGKITPFYESGVEPKWMSKWSYSWVSAIDYSDTVTCFGENAYPIGANMGIRKDLISQFDGFNTELGRTGKNMMAGEEKDMWSKVRAKGIDIYYLPDVAVKHCIPERRTTTDYIIRFAQGVGMSERVRTKNIGTFSYIKRLFSECVKWAGTIVLWTQFLLKGQREKGDVLVLFRKEVTKGLIKRTI